MFTNLPPEEIERRRTASVEEMERRDRENFDAWYQEKCDEFYWRNGQCCAGCDFWTSDGGRSGECRAAGLVSGEQVLASVGIVGWSGPLEPGYPLTSSDHWCGLFRDDFDWAGLDSAYLERIGALESGQLKPLPTPPSTGNQP